MSSKLDDLLWSLDSMVYIAHDPPANSVEQQIKVAMVASENKEARSAATKSAELRWIRGGKRNKVFHEHLPNPPYTD